MILNFLCPLAPVDKGNQESTYRYSCRLKIFNLTTNLMCNMSTGGQEYSERLKLKWTKMIHTLLAPGDRYNWNWTSTFEAVDCFKCTSNVLFKWEKIRGSPYNILTAWKIEVAVRKHIFRYSERNLFALMYYATFYDQGPSFHVYLYFPLYY